MFRSYMMDQERFYTQNIDAYPHHLWNDHHKGKYVFLEENLYRYGYFNDTSVLLPNQQGMRESSTSNKYGFHLQKIDEDDGNIRSHLTLIGDFKPRLKWNRELHACFVDAVKRLGGPKKATPKRILDMMRVEGLRLHHVKSHLQKYRAGKCKFKDSPDQPDDNHEATLGTLPAGRAISGSSQLNGKTDSVGSRATSREGSHTSRPAERGSSSSSKASQPQETSKRMIRATSETRKYKQVHARIHLQSEKHLKEYQDAQRRCLGLALESAQRTLAAHQCYRENVHNFAGPSAIHHPASTSPIPLYISYPACNTLETVKARLDEVTGDGNSQAQCSAMMVPPLFQSSEKQADSTAEELTQVTKDNPVDAYMNWESMEALDFGMKFGLDFLEPFGITGLI